MRDVDGTGDVSAATLTLTSRNGQTVGSWDHGAFAIHDDDTPVLDLSDHRLLGPAPWTVSLSAVDSAITALSSRSRRHMRHSDPDDP